MYIHNIKTQQQQQKLRMSLGILLSAAAVLGLFLTKNNVEDNIHYKDEW